MEKIVLIGGGGYCSCVIDSIQKKNEYEIVGITDPLDKGDLLGVPIIGTDDILPELFENGVKKAHITVGSIAVPTIRKRLVKMALDIGFELVTIIDPDANVSKYSKIGNMVYVAKNAIINPLTKIGNYCMINTGCIIEHGCTIADWVHIAPGTVLAADITIGDSSHIGVNSTVLQGLTIGDNVIVGAGSVVVKNVENNKTVYGVVKG